MKPKPVFALLWCKILDSSLWITASYPTRLVWITLLALKDYDGVIHLKTANIAYRANVTLEECREAMKFLSSPDPESLNDVEQGRRIREVPGGWQIVKHEQYRFATECTREYWRERQAEHRKKKIAGTCRNRKPLPGEVQYVQASDSGATEEELNRVVERNLPPKKEPV